MYREKRFGFSGPRFSLTGPPREHSLWHLWLILIAQQRPIFSVVNKAL